MIKSFSLLLLILFFFLCTNYTDDNPYDPDYEGEYFLNIEWDSLPDTLGTFIDYVVPYSSSGGKDSLYLFIPDDTLQNIIDNALFEKSTDSSFHLFFIAEYSGHISITGLALNDKPATSKDTAVIVNPFSIITFYQAVYGEVFRCYLAINSQFDTLFIKDSTDSVTWHYSLNGSCTLSIFDTLSFTVQNLQACTTKAFFVDVNKNISSEIIQISQVALIRPKVSAPNTFSYRVGTIHLPVTFSDSNDYVDSIFYCLQEDTVPNGKKVDSAASSDTLIFKLYDTVATLLTLWAKDASGLCSDKDSVIITTFIPDSINPVICLQDSSIDSAKTPSDTISVALVVSNDFGVFTVICTTNSHIDTVKMQDSIIWVAAITALTPMKYSEIKACAVDSFGNSFCITFHLYYDSTLTDITPPSLSILSPQDNSRDTTGTGTITVKVKDHNGIDTLYYELNGTYTGDADSVNDSIYTFTYALSLFHWNTITIVAKDGSGNHNDSIKELSINYNTPTSSISNPWPTDIFNIDNISGVTFSWNHAQDADGDHITYKIYYGTSVNFLDSSDTISDSIHTVDNLKGGLGYIWYIKVMTDLDTLRCPIDTNEYFQFTIRDHPASITGFNDTSATINDTITFHISATDSEGIKQYLWDFNGDGTPEETTTVDAATYSYDSVNTYTAVITVVDDNDITTSASANITITDNPPNVDAYPPGDTLYVGYNDSIHLTPSATDDGRIELYEWSFDSGSKYIEVSSYGDTSFLAGTAGLPKTLKLYFRAIDEDINISIDSMYVHINMIWTEVTNVPWIINRESFPVVADENAIFVLGGWIGSRGSKKDVWKSLDGEVWINISEDSSFTPRYTHTATIKNDTIYVAGGDGIHDIWRSEDGGVAWDSIADLKDIDNNYDPKLIGAELTTADNKIFLIGGEYGVSTETNKVFSSSDGEAWNDLNSTLGISPRFGVTSNLSTFSYNDTIWLFSKNELWYTYSELGINFGDVWGIKNTVPEINGHGGLIFYQNIMYAISGGNFWFSKDRGMNWQKMTSSGPWSASSYQRTAVFNNKMWVITDKGIWSSDDTP